MAWGLESYCGGSILEVAVVAPRYWKSTTKMKMRCGRLKSGAVVAVVVVVGSVERSRCSGLERER